MKTKILIIEDEIIIAQDIEETLLELGYEVIQIISGSDKAIDYLSFHTPDLVLCDIHIKGPLDGIEVALKIRKIKKIPFVFLTSFADRTTLERAKKALPYGYIVKPYDAKDLLSAIEVAMFKFNQELEALKITKTKVDALTNSVLTEREFEILMLLINGKNYQEIVNQLKISTNTLKYHNKNLFMKFKVNTKSEILQKLLSRFTY